MRRAGLGRRHLLRDAWWLAALVSGPWLAPDTAQAEPSSGPEVPAEAPHSDAPRSDAPPPGSPAPDAPLPDAPPPEPPSEAAPPAAPPSAPPSAEPAPAPEVTPSGDVPHEDSDNGAASNDGPHDGSGWPLIPPITPEPSVEEAQHGEAQHGEAQHGEAQHGEAHPDAHEGDDPLHPPAAPLLSHDLLAAWKGDFDRAKQLLRHGRFAEAAALFDLIGPRAPTPEEAAIARELSTLCYYWSSRGVRIDGAERSRPTHTTSSPRRRSSGEIASLYVNAVVYGLGTGTWLRVVADLDSAGGFFVPTLALTGATLGVIAVVDSEVGFDYGVPQAISSGMYVGLSQGMLWSLAYNAQAPASEEWSAAAVSSLMWGGATLGALAGGVIGQRVGTTPGRAAWVGSTALWGGALGGLTVSGLTPDGARTERGLLGAALLSTGGTVAGLLSAEAVSPSLARVRFLDLGGIVGGLLGLGVYATAAPSLETHGTLWAMNVGAVTGLLSSWMLTSRMQPDRREDDKKRAGEVPQNPLQALTRARPTLLPAHAGAQLGLAGSW